MLDAENIAAVRSSVQEPSPRSKWDACRLLSLAFLLIVAAVVVLPLIQTAHRVLPAVVEPVDEHRDPAPFPRLQLLASAAGEFAAELNRWFDDRQGFRSLFIRAKNQIDYSLFRTSSKIYIGSQGWLFNRGVDAIERVDAATLTTMEQGFVTLARRLREKGIRLIVIGYPDKSAIYPEFAPWRMPRPQPGGRYDQFRQFLANRTDLSFIDAEAILKREKVQGSLPLFYRTDMHVTWIAQVPIVKEIIARIAAAEGRHDIEWNEKFTLVHGPAGAGNQGRFLSLLRPVRDDIDYPTEQYGIGAPASDGEWIIPDRRVLQAADEGPGRPFDYEFRSRPELCGQRLPGAVLFGNSFTDLYWSLGLQRYFCFIRRTKEPIVRFPLFFSTIPPETKYMIFQYYQPFLPSEIPTGY